MGNIDYSKRVLNLRDLGFIPCDPPRPEGISDSAWQLVKLARS